MFLSPAEIKQQQLREKRGAYEREDVDALIDNVIGSYQHVWLERDRLQARVEELERETGNTKELEQLLRDGLASAQRAAEQVKEEAERQVSGLVDNAKREAEDLLEKARAKADEIVAASRKTRDRLEEETSRLERANQDVRERYKAFLQKALSVIEGTTVQKAVTPDEASVAQSDDNAPIPGAEEHKGEVGWLATVPLMAAESEEVAESIERDATKPPEPEPENEDEEDVPATVLLSAVAPPAEVAEEPLLEPVAAEESEAIGEDEPAPPDEEGGLQAPDEAYMTFGRCRRSRTPRPPPSQRPRARTIPARTIPAKTPTRTGRRRRADAYRVCGKPRSTLLVAGSGQREVTTFPRV